MGVSSGRYGWVAEVGIYLLVEAVYYFETVLG